MNILNMFNKTFAKNVDIHRNNIESDAKMRLQTQEIKKSIEYKSQKIATVPVVEETSRILVNDLFNPTYKTTFEEQLIKYYSELFYNGIVWFINITTATKDTPVQSLGWGFYGKDEVIEQGDKVFIKIKGFEVELKEEFSQCIKVIDGETRSITPQYKFIDKEITGNFAAHYFSNNSLYNGMNIGNIFIHEDGFRSKEEAESAEQVIKSKYSTGSKSFGGALLLSGKWKVHQQNAEKVSENTEKKIETTSANIYNFLGVPPQLMGLAYGATFSNYKEAQRNFYSQTLIPETVKFYNLINKYYFSIVHNNIVIPEFSAMINFIEEKEKNFNMLMALWKEGLITDDQFLQGSGFGEMLSQTKTNSKKQTEKVLIEKQNRDLERYGVQLHKRIGGGN